MVCDTRHLHDVLNEEYFGPIFGNGPFILENDSATDVTKTELFYLVTLDCNNDHCVILKVKENTEMELIRLGIFNGDEVMFRVTKGLDTIYTVFQKDGRHYSWEPSTIVTDVMSKRARAITECIENDYGINLR